VITEMGFAVQADEPPVNQRQEILERLSHGEIDVQEATRLISRLGRK